MEEFRSWKAVQAGYSTIYPQIVSNSAQLDMLLSNLYGD